MQFRPSHVSFVAKSNSENFIKIRWFLTKLQRKISWLLFYGPQCICSHYIMLWQSVVTISNWSGMAINWDGMYTRRPASADRTARRQFQATGQPVSRTQASDVTMSRFLRYELKCVHRRCFQCGPVPLRSDIKGMELPAANILIQLERQLIALQLCRWQFLYVDFCIG